MQLCSSINLRLTVPQTNLSAAELDKDFSNGLFLAPQAVKQLWSNKEESTSIQEAEAPLKKEQTQSNDTGTRQSLQRDILGLQQEQMLRDRHLVTSVSCQTSVEDGACLQWVPHQLHGSTDIPLEQSPPRTTIMLQAFSPNPFSQAGLSSFKGNIAQCFFHPKIKLCGKTTLKTGLGRAAYSYCTSRRKPRSKLWTRNACSCSTVCSLDVDICRMQPSFEALNCSTLQLF